nr:EAL domain-containing protein [Noviherbaspirillum cavernae]
MPEPRSEEELRRREERLRSLMDLSTDWYWETDEDDRFTFISDSMQRLIGLHPSIIIGKTRLDLAIDHSHPDLVKCCEKVARREPFRNIQYATNLSANGVMRYTSISGEPVFEDEVFRGYRGVGRDVTAEVDVATQLSLLAAENKALVENSLDIMMLFDKTGKILRVNEAVMDVLGYQPVEVLGKRYLDFIVAEDREKTRTIGARLNRDTNTIRDVEFRCACKDGRVVHLSLSVRWSDDRRLTYATARDLTGRYRARAELDKSNKRLFSMLESIGDAFVAIDREWRVTYVNRRTARFIGRRRDALIGKTLWEAAPELLTSSVFAYCRKAMETRRNTFFEVYYEAAHTWIEVRAYPYDGGLSVFFHDISARRAAERTIRQSEQRLREVIELTPAGYLLADAQSRLVAVNPALCDLSGYSEEELIGESMTRLFPSYPGASAASVQENAASAHGMEATLRHKHGHLCYVLINANTFRDAEKNTLSLTAFVTDITQRKQAEARLEQLATRDVLTGLPNRAALNEQLQSMLDASQQQSVAIMFIDLDRFKEVNDSMGHEPGDVLLREVACRLQKSTRPNDIVARLGGDEFVVAAPCSKGAESAAKIVGKLFAALAAPVDIAGQEVFVGASIGISMFPQDGQTKELLFQNADTAMYRAKAAGRNGYRFFEAEMSVEAKTRMALEHALRRALERGEFELHYQPRLDLKTMAIVGMEALIRWNHPQLGRVSPLQFIPIAEERGLIEAIGQWVLEEACTQTRRLMDKFGRSLRLSVNLSARQLRSADLPQQVAACLNKTGLPAHLLELELTESALIEDMEISTAVLKELKTLGISLSVDDFGTGYSALAYLRRFPLDTLKLDRSFVNQENGEIDSLKFIKAFVDLAHALNLSVVAEGVETKETLQCLREASCDEAQGYLFARPLPFNALEEFLSRLPAHEPNH